MMGNRKRDINGRKKIQKTMEDQDLFSKLPEQLIIDILSLLELQDAIKTGVLAKSWKNLWKQVSNTVVSFERYDDECMPSLFDMSLLRSLVLKKDPTLDDASFQKLLMGCPMLENLVIDDVYKFCHVDIMSQNVKRFKIDWYENHYDCECAIRDDLIINAPWLQELELSAKCVYTKCKLEDVSSLTKAILMIKFETIDEYMDFDRYLDEVNYERIPTVTRLLDSLSHVGELTLGSESLQVLAYSKVQCEPSPLFKCKHLSIETPLWKFDLPGIGCLLENAPHLETLSIKVVNWQDAYCFFHTKEVLKDGNPHLSMPNGKFMHLKNVKIDFSRCSCGDSTENDDEECSSLVEYLRLCRESTEGNPRECLDFELVYYILRSAVVLEKLVLCSSSERCFEWDCPLSRQSSSKIHYVPRLSSKLLSTFLSGNKAAAEWKHEESENQSVFTFSNYESLHPTASSSSLSYSP